MTTLSLISALRDGAWKRGDYRAFLMLVRMYERLVDQKAEDHELQNGKGEL